MKKKNILLVVAIVIVLLVAVMSFYFLERKKENQKFVYDLERKSRLEDLANLREENQKFVYDVVGVLDKFNSMNEKFFDIEPTSSSMYNYVYSVLDMIDDVKIYMEKWEDSNDLVIENIVDEITLICSYYKEYMDAFQVRLNKKNDIASLELAFVKIKSTRDKIASMDSLFALSERPLFLNDKQISEVSNYILGFSWYRDVFDEFTSAEDKDTFTASSEFWPLYNLYSGFHSESYKENRRLYIREKMGLYFLDIDLY